MGRCAFWCVGALLVAASPLAAVPATAQRNHDDEARCMNLEKRLSADEEISACTRLIDSGQYKGRSLAIALTNRGSSHARKGNIDRAIADFDEAIRVHPMIADTFYNRGNIHYDKMDYDRAIADYSEAIRLEPMHVAAYFNRGRMYHDMKDFDRAIADYSEAIRIDPNFVGAIRARNIANDAKKKQ